MDFKGRNYIVLGMGISGRSASRVLLNNGAHVYAYDRNIESLKNDPVIQELLTNGLKLFLDSVENLPQKYCAVILSPGIPLSHPICNAANSNGIEVIGENELACRELNCPIIGITGTNGKTTVTSQIAHTLNYFGIPAKAMGNIGRPLIELLDEPQQDTVIVLELSSFQLETMHTKILDVAVLLNLSVDHLDRYPSMKEYGLAKINIGNCLKKGNPLYVSTDVIGQFPDLFLEADYPILQFDSPERIIPIEFLPYHDRQNYAAVKAVCEKWDLGWNDILEAAKTFQKGSHRIEYIATIDGVDFYDDSKGTNIDAVIKAIASLPQKIVLIAGGVAKGARFTSWKDPFYNKVVAICAIGEAAKQIKQELELSIPVSCHETMEDAVKAAFMIAHTGDVVILSPGCASLDMFKDYAHRGEVYQQCVRQLETVANVHS